METPQPFETRKLAAILIADIVGFSRLISADETDTLSRVRALQNDVFAPTITANQGRVVKKTGDGVLAEFRSVVEAARCALALQDKITTDNIDVSKDKQIGLRVGLHLGDVVEEADGDLMGDGVNIAARLEGLAPTGGICLSEDAFRQVRGRLDLDAIDMGEQELKNIAEPMRVFCIGGDVTSASSSLHGLEQAFTKPSIAVLPFTNMSGDPDQEYFVDGMVEDIITALSRFDELAVIARNSTFVYKGKAVEIRQVGRDLGVRYVLEGSVRKAGQRLRITGQLIDAATGAHLWAEKFDGQLEDVFDLQDQITTNVVGELEPNIRKSEIARVRRTPAANLGAYDLLLRALPKLYAVRPEENRKALEMLEQALELDPDYGAALGHAGWALVQRLTRGWPAYCNDDRARAVSWAYRALAAGPDESRAQVLGGFVLTMLREDYEAGLSAVRRSLAINPGSSHVMALAGSALTFGGAFDEGRIILEKSIALSRNDPTVFAALSVVAVANLFTGNMEAAIVFANESLTVNPNWDSPRWVLITAYVETNRIEKARSVAATLLEANPGARASVYEQALPLRNPEHRAKVARSLMEAGIPT
ncbi:adenylate/guanylate cyclase domain-containing protein [Roseobacter sp.]|uniref:adenylate/guanylate cyclase domain-containing protein n=1 Tax=Roseobacter sp. TaxID=1907202 RepID=UPI00385A64F1